MSATLPTAHLDRSDLANGVYLEENGQRVSIEEAFRRGFIVSPNDANAFLTWAQQYLEAKAIHAQ